MSEQEKDDADRVAKEMLASLDRESAIFALCVALAANAEARPLTEGQLVEATNVDRLLLRVLRDYGAEWLEEYRAAKRARKARPT